MCIRCDNFYCGESYLLNQEIPYLISKNNSIKFGKLTLNAKVKELRNTIAAYGDQIDNERERPNKTFTHKTGYPYVEKD